MTFRSEESNRQYIEMINRINSKEELADFLVDNLATGLSFMESDYDMDYDALNNEIGIIVNKVNNILGINLDSNKYKIED